MANEGSYQRFSGFVDAADAAAWKGKGDEAVVYLCAASDLLGPDGSVEEEKLLPFTLERFWALWLRYVLPTLGANTESN